MDWDIIALGLQGWGVSTTADCAVSAQGTPDMTVAVSAGTAAISGSSVAVASGNLSVSAADPTYPRFDLVVVSNAGVKSVVTGTANAVPVFPAIPSNSLVLAAVYIPVGLTSITSGRITDKRVGISAVNTFAAAFSLVFGG